MNTGIIIALDGMSDTDAFALADKLRPEQCRLKVGKEMFTRYGPSVVEGLQQRGFEIFLDLKFHDIPNTVAKAVTAAADLGVWMVNVHASGGQRMMAAAAEALANHAKPPMLIAVTVLTSMSAAEMQQLGLSMTIAERVSSLAKLADDCGVRGVVCSAQEAADLRRERGDHFCLVTPGIRLPDDSANDQRRIVSPQQALANGSNYLVIGRPITLASDPAEKLTEILNSL